MSEASSLATEDSQDNQNIERRSRRWYEELSIDTGGTYHESSPKSSFEDVKSEQEESEDRVESSDHNIEDRAEIKQDQNEELNINAQLEQIRIKKEIIELNKTRGEFIDCDKSSEHYLSDREELMTSTITKEVIIVLKTIYFNLFHSESLKTKMFIIQVNNKITDVIETIKRQKICYMMLLLRDSALK